MGNPGIKDLQFFRQIDDFWQTFKPVYICLAWNVEVVLLKHNMDLNFIANYMFNLFKDISYLSGFKKIINRLGVAGAVLKTVL